MEEHLPERLLFVQDRNDAENPDTSCGLGPCAPHCFQRFANHLVYLVFFCLAGIVQGIYYTYLIGVSPTLEKRFSYGTKITGYILLADNVSPLLFSIMLGYCGKYFHRPRLVSFGMMVNALACLLAWSPFYFYGSKVKVYSSKKDNHLCSGVGNFEDCNKLLWENFTAVCIIFSSNFLKGIGSSAYYTIGMAYLDDTVKKKDSPLYLGNYFILIILLLVSMTHQIFYKLQITVTFFNKGYALFK